MRCTLCLLALAALSACESTRQPGDPFEARSEQVYEHTRKFMLDEVQAVLKPRYLTFEEVDVEKGRLVTSWHTFMDPRTERGERHRLVVELEGPDNQLVVMARHEAEVNTEQMNTLIGSAAKWIALDANGTRADELLRNLKIRYDRRARLKDRLLKPREDGEDEERSPSKHESTGGAPR